MQHTILVSYDLCAPGKDYTKLISHLKSFDDWVKPLESLWLLKTDMTAKQTRDTTASYIDQNDKLFVVDVTGKEAAWHNLSPEISDWIKNYL